MFHCLRLKTLTWIKTSGTKHIRLHQSVSYNSGSNDNLKSIAGNVKPTEDNHPSLQYFSCFYLILPQPMIHHGICDGYHNNA